MGIDAWSFDGPGNETLPNLRAKIVGNGFSTPSFFFFFNFQGFSNVIVGLKTG